MNLAGDRVDDIPDRRLLRQLIEALEKGAGATPLPSAPANLALYLSYWSGLSR
jgi:hypothetical protein